MNLSDPLPKIKPAQPHPAADPSPPVDPRLAFLARAAARHLLVEAGALTLDQAFGDLIACLPVTL